MRDRVKTAEEFLERIAIAKAARNSGRRRREAESQQRAKQPGKWHTGCCRK